MEVCADKINNFHSSSYIGRPNQRIVCNMDGFLEGMGSSEKHKRV
jgi:hypothetical protein